MAYYDSLKLEKGMYQTAGKNFTQVLESLDPSDNYKNSSLEELDAYQRQLKRFDIKVSGSTSDVVDKFFQTSDSMVLFPEYISRAVWQGVEMADVLPSFVATKTIIDSLDYRPITSEPSDDEKDLKIISEGASIPQTVIKTQDSLVELYKRGRMLVASYEAIRFQRLDLFTVMLKQIGAHIATAQLKDAVNVLENGNDGNTVIKKVSGDASKMSYDNLVKMWAEMSPYQLNVILANTAEMQNILGLTEMKDAVAGLNFQATGNMVTPLGATLIHVPDVADNTVIGLDKNCALEMVQAGEIVTDFDKIIDRQLERAVISCTAGFAKIFQDASIQLTTN